MDNDDSEEEDVIILTAERSDVIQKRYVWTIKKRLQKGKVVKLFVNSVFLFFDSSQPMRTQETLGLSGALKSDSGKNSNSKKKKRKRKSGNRTSQTS